ncbi:MAG: putative CoA-binding protein [Bacteroidia bacterium]|jgi:predicted CoA-binding protein
MESKKTAIIGATPDEHRYAYMAAERLMAHEFEFVPVGIKTGAVFGNKILDIKSKPDLGEIHTVTMYVGAEHFTGYEDYIIGLNPKRIIFNPGSENRTLEDKAIDAGIEVVHGCTLVMLGSGQY